jgi:uncharacterized protein (DUF1810 family)
MPAGSLDPFDLQRFLTAQAATFDDALTELRAGRKRSHWMWFVFPQVAGLGRSATAGHFAIRGLEEARAYAQHEILGPRLVACARALLAVEHLSASDILGFPDDVKLRSSMTLFEAAWPEEPAFGRVLEKYFDGERDGRTLELTRRDGPCNTPDA